MLLFLSCTEREWLFNATSKIATTPVPGPRDLWLLSWAGRQIRMQNPLGNAPIPLGAPAFVLLSSPFLPPTSIDMMYHQYHYPAYIAVSG